MQRSKEQKGKGGERINPVSLKPCINGRKDHTHAAKRFLVKSLAVDRVFA